jgi:hypothetical protein
MAGEESHLCMASGNFWDTLDTYAIYYGNKGTLSVMSVTDLVGYVIISNLLHSNFNVIPTVIRRWEIQTLAQDLLAVRIRYYKVPCTLYGATAGFGKCSYGKWRRTAFKGDNFQNVASTKPKTGNLLGYNCKQLCMLRS